MTRVLIAEDQTVIRLDLRSQLEDAGYVVCAEARDGAEALELVVESKPDLLVLDVKMPMLDGIEVARWLASEHPVPVVFVTAYGDRRLVERAAGVGAFAFLTKPFRSPDLFAAIELAQSRHRELTEVRSGSKRGGIASRRRASTDSAR